MKRSPPNDANCRLKDHVFPLSIHVEKHYIEGEFRPVGHSKFQAMAIFLNSFPFSFQFFTCLAAVFAKGSPLF